METVYSVPCLLIFNNEDHHVLIRKILVQFEELNKEKFAKYLTASDATNINDHICSMVKPFVWGTQVELLAGSSFFQVPVYYSTVKHSKVHTDGTCLGQ